MRLYYVEDDHTLRLLVTVMLEPEPDIALTGASSTGQKAIEEICQLDPNVVLLDYQLTDMSGIDVVKAVRARGHDPHFIMFSGFAQEDPRLAEMQSLDIDYLLKTRAVMNLPGALRDLRSSRRTTQHRPARSGSAG